MFLLNIVVVTDRDDRHQPMLCCLSVVKFFKAVYWSAKAVNVHLFEQSLWLEISRELERFGYRTDALDVYRCFSGLPLYVIKRVSQSW